MLLRMGANIDVQIYSGRKSIKIQTKVETSETGSFPVSRGTVVTVQLSIAVEKRVLGGMNI